MASNGNDNDDDDANSNNIIFIIKDTKLHVLVVTLSAKDNQKLSKLLSEGFKSSVYFLRRNIDIFSNQILQELTDCLFWFIQIKMGYKARIYYLPKGVMKNYNAIINGNNFYE